MRELRPAALRRRAPGALLLALLFCACPSLAAQAQIRAGAGASPARSAAADPLGRYGDQRDWISTDKLLHFAVSAGGAGGMHALGRDLGLSRWQAALASAAVMGTVGVLREVWRTDPEDPLSRDHLSRKDLVWDGVGIVVGISVADLLVTRRSRRTEAERVRD